MPLKTSIDELPALNLTSMMDVTFLLIFFFMVGTKFSDAESHIELEVPQVSQTAPLVDDRPQRSVNIYPDGRITLDRQPLSLTELRSALEASHQARPSQGVFVRGDARVVFQRVAEVLNTCKQAGISELGISVRLGPESQ